MLQRSSVSVRVQPRSRTHRRYILRDVLQGIGLCDGLGWLSKLNSIKQAFRKDRLELFLAWAEATIYRKNFFFREAWVWLLKSFN